MCPLTREERYTSLNMHWVIFNYYYLFIFKYYFFLELLHLLYNPLFFSFSSYSYYSKGQDALCIISLILYEIDTRDINILIFLYLFKEPQKMFTAFWSKLSTFISLSFITVWWGQRVVMLLICPMGKISEILGIPKDD